MQKLNTLGISSSRLRNLVYSITIVFSMAVFSAQAKCNLPIADGTDELVSDRNIAGYFVSIKNNEILIEEYKTKKIERVRLSSLRVAYSAYGGDLDVRELKRGVPLRIWYKNCTVPVNGKPLAAYIEFFSNDLSDGPPRDYFSARGQ